MCVCFLLSVYSDLNGLDLGESSFIATSYRETCPAFRSVSHAIIPQFNNLAVLRKENENEIANTVLITVKLLLYRHNRSFPGLRPVVIVFGFS